MPPDPATVPVGSRHALPAALSLGPPFPGRFVLSDSDGQRVQPARPPRRLVRSTSPSSRLFLCSLLVSSAATHDGICIRTAGTARTPRLSAREGEVGHDAGAAH